MATELYGGITGKASKSVRNVRVIDRSQIRGKTKDGNRTAFAVFQGATPVIYSGSVNVSGVFTGTDYTPGGNMSPVETSGRILISTDQIISGSNSINFSESVSGNISVVEIPTDLYVSGVGFTGIEDVRKNYTF